MSLKHFLQEYDASSKYVPTGKVLGAGAFGKVFTAKIADVGEVVAVKQAILKGKQGVEFSVLREIKLLREINHKNVIKLLDVYPQAGNLNMVLEYCILDLRQVMHSDKIRMGPAEIKSILQMMLKGVNACHKAWVLHRDLKPENIMLGLDGQMKLADFGLGRIFGTPKVMSNYVVTRWYRSPELLMGATEYGPSVDIWSVGCILAELLIRNKFFHGETDMEVLSRIVSVRGNPTEANWPGCTKLARYYAFPSTKPLPLRSVFPHVVADNCFDLLEKMWQWDPLKRISAEEALRHPYFAEAPSPTPSDYFKMQFDPTQDKHDKL